MIKKVLLLLLIPTLLFSQINNWRKKTINQLSNMVSGTTDIGSKSYWETKAYNQIYDILSRLDTVRYVTDFTNIDNAVASLPNGGPLVVPSGTFNINGSSLTIPSDVELIVSKGVTINGTSSKTITIEGTLNAGLYQIFGNNVAVSFDTGAVYQICPEWWGAKPGDAVDDSDALIDAITSTSGAGEIVQLQAGRYISDTLITINRDNVAISGRYPFTEIYLEDASNIDQMIYIDGCTNIVLEDLQFNNNESGQTAGELRCIQTADTVTNLLIRNCTFEGNGRTLASGSYAIWIDSCYYATIDNIYVDGWNSHDCIVLRSSEYIEIKNSTFKNLQYCGIANTTNAKHINIHDNFFHNIGDTTADRGHAIYTSSGDYNYDKSIWPADIIISNNIIDNVFGDCIIAEWAYRMIISNNLIRGFYTEADGDSTGDTGISCNASGSVIIGNYVQGMTTGITLFSEVDADSSSSGRMMVIGNSVWDCGWNSDVAAIQREGIWLDDVQGCIVALNMSGNSGDSLNTQWRGIYSSGVADRNLVALNGLYYNRDHGTYFAAADTNYTFGNMVYDTSDVVPNLPTLAFLSASDQHKMAFTFYYDSISANASDEVMFAGGSSANKAYRLNEAGSIVNITMGISDSITAGYIRGDIYLWNTLDAGDTVSTDTLDYGYATFDPGDMPFDALSTLSIKLSTSADWALKNDPLKGCIIITVLVEM